MVHTVPLHYILTAAAFASTGHVSAERAMLHMALVSSILRICSVELLPRTAANVV